MKKLVLLILPIIIASTEMNWCQRHSYEQKIARYEKKAVEFKKTFRTDHQILYELIDSVAQKVFFIEKNVEDYDYLGAPYHRIKVHDYATDETKQIIPDSGDVEGFYLCGTEYLDSKLIKDRLFIIVHSNCMRRYEETGVFYVNVRDNSLHYVESCDKAVFGVNNEICIHKYYFLGGFTEDGEFEYDHKEYNLSALLSDEAYADNRKEQKHIEEGLAAEWAAEWRRKEKEKEEMKRMKEWFFGNWEYSGYDEWFGRYTTYVCISENNLRWGYNGKESYNGPYEINMEDRKIYFNRHNGFSTYINFDPRNQRLSDGDGHYFTKVNRSVGASSSNNYAGNTYGSNTRGNVLFRRDSDVIAYTSSHTFKNSMGNRISISFQGMSVNGSLLTNAPRVIYFNGSTATISVSSPYTGGGAMIISVDASRGTITDGSGDVFWMVN